MYSQIFNASTSTAPRQDPIPLALKTTTAGDFALPPIHPTPSIAPLLSQSNLASKFGLKNKNKIGFQEIHMSDEEQKAPAGDKAEQIAKKGRTSSMSVPHKSIDKENKK